MAYGRHRVRESMPCLRFPDHFLMTFFWKGRAGCFAAREVPLQKTVGRHEGPATRATQIHVVSIGKVGDQCDERLAPMADAAPYPTQNRPHGVESPVAGVHLPHDLTTRKMPVLSNGKRQRVILQSSGKPFANKRRCDSISFHSCVPGSGVRNSVLRVSTP